MADEDLDTITRRADALIEDHAALRTRLVALRKEHGLSQALVAERMGVSQPTVAGFERYDANPTLATLRRYALAVGARTRSTVIDDCADAHRSFVAVVTAATLTPAPAARPLSVPSWSTRTTVLATTGA
ncbi:helix-turn-helix transcriptional regulator [Cellulomonas sp. S1-8]|uniref:helix-turn-helix transcriptional regulator n=1 Tax=Cellulomonas sp. S1-8 TaxID=2904790 RepID=UPI0022432F31|nr:helix-turn-helix transcriptional regulator [Cellulomonas sp. S1-8]UZN02680.1 helix-turn-helix domain-containing protein [Cellulomonas sp. S1-8]